MSKINESGNPINGDHFYHTDNHILNQSELWFQILDNQGRTIHLNPYAQNLTGFSIDELNNNNLFWERLFRTRETGLRLLNLYLSLVRHGKNVKSKLTEIKIRSGEKKNFLWSLNCIKDENDHITGASIVAIEQQNVSGLPKMPEKKANSRYRTIFRNAPIGFFRSLPEGRFLEVNNALATMLGYNTPEDVLEYVDNIGTNVYFEPEFRIKVLEKILSSGNVESFETTFKNTDGQPIDVRVNISARYDAEIENHILEGTIEDISSRKAFERKLNQNLLKYSTLFEKSPISIWEIDYSEVRNLLLEIGSSNESLKKIFKRNPDIVNKIRQSVKIIDVNQATLDLFDVENKEELYKSHQIYTGTNLTEMEFSSMNAILENKATFEHQTVLKTLRKGDKHIIVRWVAAPNTEKPYSRVLVSMIDITMQKEEHEALRKSKNQLSSLLSSMDDLVFIIDQFGKYLYVAPTRPELLISSAKNLEGKYLENFLEKDLKTKFVSIIQKSIKEKKTISLDYPLSLKGKKLWFEAKISPLTEDSVIVVARNITERINSDKANQVMLNVAKAISMADELNELFELIRTEIDKILDTKNFFIALFNEANNTLELPYFKDERDSFDHFPAANTISSLVIKEKRTRLLHTDEIMKLADAGTINLVGTVAKVWLGIPLMVEGEVLGLMVVQNYESEDSIREEHRQLLEMISPQISLSIKRKQSEQLLKESEKQLRESNQTKDRFFNIIAHDLKNPFNAIIGFTSLLTEEWGEFDDDDKISMISSIKSSSEGAYKLLMNLLDWSRLHVGKMRFEPEFIDYSSLVRLNFSLLKTAADKKNIKLQSEGICDKMIWADPNMIKTVIRNLISNAIKFTAGNGTIKVKCFKQADYPGMMLLSISDNGIGISENELGNLFSLDRTESKSGTDGESGTGLGLVLCKEFVEKNLGKIWAESETGKGSTFFIALPVRPL